MSAADTSAGLELPSYLRRDPSTGRLQLILHGTWVQDYKRCPLKHQLRYGWNIERAVPRVQLNYGGAIHEALAMRYRGKHASVDELESWQGALFDRWFAEQPQPDDEWRTAARAKQSMTAYNAFWADEDWTVLAVEESFSRALGKIICPEPKEFSHPHVEPFEGVDVIFEGTKDLRVIHNGGVWVVDHKTAADWNDDPAENNNILTDRRSFQFRGYAWEERERNRENASMHPLPVRGVYGNYVIARKPYSENPAYAAKRSTKTGLKERDQFWREPYAYDDATLDEWRVEALKVAKRILADWVAQDWEMAFDVACGRYGRCEYYDYCEESPDRREAELSSSRYRYREPGRRKMEGEP